ncbi:GNAT family N-acetyltransferase [Pantoea sp.]|uniref:GNAT family N-acetyltransferase n=1 Tax=Pantoea sp. TaxID=69393 RepID=UPI00289999D6|nr:GNAT family N-acetyltransferase [Pantoea sp.]
MFVYEKLEVKHLPFLYEIRFSVKENLLLSHHIQYLMRDQAIKDIKQGGGWICRVGEEYVGVAFGLFIPEPIIGGLFVKPEYESMGIGTELLRKVTDWLFSKGAEYIILTTDVGTKAERFYKKNGWVVQGLDEFGQVELKKERELL